MNRIPKVESFSNKKRILFVSYPLLPANDESCGGAEQVLVALERELARQGYRTVVAGCEGSKAAGEIFVTGRTPEEADRFENRQAEHNARIVEYVAKQQKSGDPFDLIHDKSGSFWKCASAVSVPVLATLHLPRSFYPDELFKGIAPNVFFNCVSKSQQRSFTHLPNMLGVVENGIELSQFPLTTKKQGYLLWMGRICEEKAPHIAIDVAEETGFPLLIVGDVYPFSYHQKYYQREVQPRLAQAKTSITFIQRPPFQRKVGLVRYASALLVTSLVEETSSIVSMEAMACGTPVIGLRRGAIPEVVVNGETGFLVENIEEMSALVRRAKEINPHTCRLRIEKLFSATLMADGYKRLYSRMDVNHSVESRVA